MFKRFEMPVAMLGDRRTKSAITKLTNATRWAILFCTILIVGCAQKMMDQRRVESQEPLKANGVGSASLALPLHTIVASDRACAAISAGPTAIGPLDTRMARSKDDDGYWTGRVQGDLVSVLPERVFEDHDLRQLIERGQTRYDIFCAPCHDPTGSGNGIVARRGFKYPPSFHSMRLRQQPLGYIFNVASNGRTAMPGYRDFLSTDDRWAITAYVRTLQFSQYAPRDKLTDSDLAKLSSEENPRGREVVRAWSQAPEKLSGKREEEP